MASGDLKRGSGVDDTAMCDDGDPVAECFDLIGKVTDQYDGGAELADATDHIPNVAARGRVEALGEFVEEHELWVVEQCQCDE